MRQYAKSIERSGGYLISLINNILDISRIESGKSHGDKITSEAYSCVCGYSSQWRGMCAQSQTKRI
ncbi:hypothetical protein [Anaerostipes hadrus]|uniref:hypothetical protein n=1 Tax=Anaerostipes hadrus TaxID=649756 RepID=UPI003A1ACB7C